MADLKVINAQLALKSDHVIGIQSCLARDLLQHKYMMVASPVGRVEHGNILVGEVEPSVKSCQQCRQHLYRLACGTHESLFLYVAKVGDCISCG